MATKVSAQKPSLRYRLRDYRADDFYPLLALDQLCFAEGIAYSDFELDYYLRLATSFAIVAEAVTAKPEQEHAIAGVILVHRKPNGKAHVITIDVHAEHRRGGLGSQL